MQGKYKKQAGVISILGIPIPQFLYPRMRLFATNYLQLEKGSQRANVYCLQQPPSKICASQKALTLQALLWRLLR